MAIIPDNWNPLEAAYNSPFNSYDSGPGANLERSLQLPRRVVYTEDSDSEYYSLYVSGISPRITEVGLKNIFSNFGQPLSVKIMHGKAGAKANYGFVSFSTLREAQVAISELDKKPPYCLNVSFAKPSERGKPMQDRQITLDRKEPLCHIKEYKLPDSLIDSLPLDPDELVEESEREYAEGCEFLSYGGHCCDVYGNEIPSVAKLRWTCSRDGQRVIIGRGSHQKYGCRYSLPDISEDRRQQIEAVIKEKVYYNRKKDGIYEYSEEETYENRIGPCNYCSQMTRLVCEQCSTTLYCSTNCQIKDYPHHKRFCGSGIDLHISTQGEKRCVAVKLEAANSTNSESHDTFKGQDNPSSCSTELVCNKSSEIDYRFREISVTDSPRVTKDKSFKNQHVNNRSESSEVNSRNNENVQDCNQLKLKVDRHDNSCSSDIQNQRRNDKKNSSNFKDSQKSTMNNTEIIEKSNTSQCDIANDCTKTESKNGQKELSPSRQGKQNLVVGKTVTMFLPFDVSTEVIISYVVDCGEFWVQKRTDFCRIKTITEDLMEDMVNAVPLEDPKQKSKCAAKYAEGWYRGLVVSTDPLKVHFVDWGNTEEFSSIDDIKVLPEKFCKYPPMACKIRLVDGTPDEYLKKTEFETLKVKPLSKASDGALLVEVEGVEEVSRESSEGISDPPPKIDNKIEPYQPEEPNLNCDVKCTKQDSSVEREKQNKNFPTEDLVLNVATQVEICKIEENSFWVILQMRKEKFSELLYVLQKVAEQSNPLLPTVNDLCLAMHENLWSRGFIKNVKTLEVFFFDFGETAECSQDNVKELPVEFHSYPPALAHKLYFVKGTPNKYLNKREGDCLRVKPISKHDDGSWLVEMEETISNNTPVGICKQMDRCRNKSILAHNVYTEVVVVVKQSDNESMCYVQPQTMIASLYEMIEYLQASRKTENFKPDVGTICASLFEDIWCRCVVRNICQENVTVFYIDYGNTEENVSLRRLQPIPEKYVDIPPQAVLVKVIREDHNEDIILYNRYFVRPTSELPDGTPVVHIRKDCIQVEENVNSMTAAQNQEKCVSNERIQLETVHILPNARVKISFVYDTSTVYVQLTDKQSLDIMEEILQETGSHCQTAPLMDIQPLVGDVVACKYFKDSNWYRAKILERQEDKYSILFVDYGNKALVTLENIRSLPKKYQNVPAQCIKIGLADCNATELTPAAQQCLFEFTDQLLIADFKNSDLSSVILKTEDGLVLNEKLKEKLMPAWKKALLANEDPTRNKLFFMEDLEYVTLPQDKVVNLKVLLYSPPNILVMCNISTDLHKYVMTTLTDEISDYCNLLTEQTYNPRARELCCVNIPKSCKESIVTSELGEDTAEHGCRKWYRAFCLQSNINSSLVSLVDFGIQLYVPHSCIRCFVPDFISTPAMACFCTMEGIPKEPSEKLIEKLKCVIHQKKMYEVTVIKKQCTNRYSVHVPYIIDVLKTENLL